MIRNQSPHITSPLGIEHQCQGPIHVVVPIPIIPEDPSMPDFSCYFVAESAGASSLFSIKTSVRRSVIALVSKGAYPSER